MISLRLRANPSVQREFRLPLTKRTNLAAAENRLLLGSRNLVRLESAWSGSERGCCSADVAKLANSRKAPWCLPFPSGSSGLVSKLTGLVHALTSWRTAPPRALLRIISLARRDALLSRFLVHFQRLNQSVWKSGTQGGWPGQALTARLLGFANSPLSLWRLSRLNLPGIMFQASWAPSFAAGTRIGLSPFPALFASPSRAR